MADSIQHYLEELGKISSNEIALLLEAQGIKGYQGIANHCPIAHYLCKQLGVSPLDGIVTVGDRSIFYDRHVEGVGEEGENIDCPFSVIAFIRCFDDGEYPKLVYNTVVK